MDQSSGGVKDKLTHAKDAGMEMVDKAKRAALTAKDAAMTTKEAVGAFVDEAKKNDLKGNAKEAMHKTGDTVRDVRQTVKDETRQTKESFRGGSSSELR